MRRTRRREEPRLTATGVGATATRRVLRDQLHSSRRRAPTESEDRTPLASAKRAIVRRRVRAAAGLQTAALEQPGERLRGSQSRFEARADRRHAREHRRHRRRRGGRVAHVRSPGGGDHVSVDELSSRVRCDDSPASASCFAGGFASFTPMREPCSTCSAHNRYTIESSCPNISRGPTSSSHTSTSIGRRARVLYATVRYGDALRTVEHSLCAQRLLARLEVHERVVVNLLHLRDRTRARAGAQVGRTRLRRQVPERRFGAHAAGRCRSSGEEVAELVLGDRRREVAHVEHLHLSGAERSRSRWDGMRNSIL